jgi:hypothetical protein
MSLHQHFGLAYVGQIISKTIHSQTVYVNAKLWRLLYAYITFGVELEILKHSIFVAYSVHDSCTVGVHRWLQSMFSRGYAFNVIIEPLITHTFWDYLQSDVSKFM